MSLVTTSNIVNFQLRINLIVLLALIFNINNIMDVIHVCFVDQQTILVTQQALRVGVEIISARVDRARVIILRGGRRRHEE